VAAYNGKAKHSFCCACFKRYLNKLDSFGFGFLAVRNIKATLPISWTTWLLVWSHILLVNFLRASLSSRANLILISSWSVNALSSSAITVLLSPLLEIVTTGLSPCPIER
jgi:hypothetical protein